MKKIFTLIFSLLFIANVFAQNNSNPVIGKKEIQTTLFYFFFDDPVEKYAFGAELIYRKPLEKYCKAGIGGLIAADKNGFPFPNSDVSAYGAIFGDISFFIGNRQKWTISSQLGYGIFKKTQQGENSFYRGFSSTTGGLYYSIPINYRIIISKKFLISVSPFWVNRNFHYREAYEQFSSGSILRTKFTFNQTAVGLKVGFVF